MKADIYEYRNYREYLRAVIVSKPKRGRGMKVALARAANCPVSLVSQVLSRERHFSLEQAEGVNEFVGHTHEEAQFFFLLLQHARAGTPALRKRLQHEIDLIVARRLVLKERLGVGNPLSVEAQATFYSSWLYSAIHVLLSIERFQTKEALSHHLGLSLKKTSEILEFLVSVGMAEGVEHGRFRIGPARIHLGTDSPLISKLHSNWRLQAIRSLEREDSDVDLHYSSAVTISEADSSRIKSMLVKFIAEIKTIIRESKEEGAHCFSIDFFRI